MPKSESSESEENVPSGDGGQQKASNYEMQRLKRIEENRKRMEALGLHKMADSFMGSVQKTQKNNSEKKGKKKIVDEDDEYNPTEDNEELNSSAEEDDYDDEFSFSHNKVKKKSPNPKKQAPVQKPIIGSDFVGDDDDALNQAIALSLQDYAKSKTPAKDTVDVPIGKRKDNSYIQNDSGKKKRKTPEKPIRSRVQMTEDEMIAHFFQFDEIGKGGINLRDIHRLATAHDFTWSEKEISDMVSCFDSDGDGKINLDDFRKIVCRCNMLKGSVGETG